MARRSFNAETKVMWTTIKKIADVIVFYINLKASNNMIVNEKFVIHWNK